MSVDIVFETHSISTDNERGIATGWLPGGLSAEGRRLASELGARRRGVRVTALRRQCIDEPFPGGESYRDTVERMRDFLSDVGPGFDGERILVIGHSATRWALEHLLDGVPLEALVDATFEWQEGWEYRLG